MPMPTVVDALTDGTSAGKYSLRRYATPTIHGPIVRLSTNGSTSDPSTNFRARVIRKLRGEGVDAAIYRVDKYPRVSGGQPTHFNADWVKLFGQRYPLSDYMAQSTMILVDGFGAPYELGPAIFSGRKVMLVGTLVQSIEAFLNQGEHYVRVENIDDIQLGLAALSRINSSTVRARGRDLMESGVLLQPVLAVEASMNTYGTMTFGSLVTWAIDRMASRQFFTHRVNARRPTEDDPYSGGWAHHPLVFEGGPCEAKELALSTFAGIERYTLVPPFL